MPGDRIRIATDYSERIILPKPDDVDPDVANAQLNCPHDASDLLDWQNDATWDGSPPGEGQDVVLPENTKIVIRQTVSAQLGIVTIPSSSSLIIAENSETGIAVNVAGMVVEGELTAGSETCRIQSPITITLHGSRPVDVETNAQDPSYKGISVQGGTIHLHGKRYFRTWTRLAQAVLPGENVVLLQHETNWEPGQRIVLVTTVIKDSREYHQNEEHTIAATDANGRVIVLESNVAHKHSANMGYQAEVGLLTRTITIQGAADDSEPTDLDPLDCETTAYDRFGDKSVPCPYTELTGFGGHVMVQSGGKGYVEGTEFYRMGQTNVLGRYPIHFHLLGDSCSDCYLRDSSVHRSYYRCVSIHGTLWLS